MITAQQCIKRYGLPQPANESKYMTSWPVPADIQESFSHVRFSALGTTGFPKKIYCNKDLVQKLESALRNVMNRGLSKILITWDGCFMVRNMRGLSSYSLHSWGLAVDLNASFNQLGKRPTLPADFVKCFTDAGFDWGGVWSRPDGMHFQLAQL